MRILITGGAGFVGGRLIKRLAGEHEIFALVRKAPAQPAANVTWLVQDLAAPNWSVALPEKIDAVVHLAQSSHFRDFPNQAMDVYAVATGATMRLLDWSHKAGARNFVLGSTGGLYGTSEQPVSETGDLPDQRNQLGFYFAAKRAAELLAQQYAGQINVATLRFFFVYGAGQPAPMLLPRLASNVRDGNPIFLHGDDGLRLNPIHVDDAVNAIRQSLQLTESRVFNIAGPEVTTLRAIGEEIGHQVGRAPVFNVDKITKPNHLVADIARMSRALGAPKIGVAAGIAELLGKAKA
ncbi:MAG: NAD(P)-dependent oxidoreductase [Pseudomonadota bacterium]